MQELKNDLLYSSLSLSLYCTAPSTILHSCSHSCILLAQREVASFMSSSYVLSMKKTSMLIGHFWPMDFSICFLTTIECLARLLPRIMGRSAVIAVALLGLASVAVASQVVAFGDSWGSFSRTFNFLYFFVVLLASFSLIPFSFVSRAPVPADVHVARLRH